MAAFVLDSLAIMCLLYQEDAADQLGEIIEAAQRAVEWDTTELPLPADLPV